MVKHIATLFVLLSAGVVSGDTERDRRARVALALAAVSDGPPIAPAPRAVVLPGYAEAYRRAVGRGEPLVLYVGCAGRHPMEQLPGAAVGAVAELSGYEPGTVVIGYPYAGRVFVHAMLRCPALGDSVMKAVEEASKKSATPPAKSEAVPVPLSWEVRAPS